MLIRGVDRSTAENLVRLGVTRFAQIARWQVEDVARVNSAINGRGRVERENWIEQAAILVKGGRTGFARSKALPAPMPSPAGSPAAALPAATSPTVPPTPDAPRETAPAPAAAAPEALPPNIPATASPPRQAASALAPAPGFTASSMAGGATAPQEPVPPSRTMVGDSLQRIAGIDAATEQLLRSQGIVLFSQIAGWTAADARRIERLLGRVGRVGDENWIEQARILAAGGPPPSRPRSHLSGMKSVRSEALRGAFAASEAGSVDDLKRIRGIGVLIEKRLNAHAITGFEQIANWTNADIDRVSQALDIPGKIERENWVEQARILASGGQTVYSRRP